MRLEINETDGPCKVRVGSVGRGDPDAELHIVKQVGDDWEKVVRTFVHGKKVFTFPEFEPGNYHVMVIGDKKAGVATTGGRDVPFPFNVFLDPPVEHAKDYLRLSLPVNEPLPPKLADMVSKALKEKGSNGEAKISNREGDSRAGTEQGSEE